MPKLDTNKSNTFEIDIDEISRNNWYDEWYKDWYELWLDKTYSYRIIAIMIWFILCILAWSIAQLRL